MKKRLGKIIFAILFLCYGGLAQATTIDFNDHQIGIIQEGDNYDQVTLHDFAIVNMVGGEVGGLGIYDSSTFNLQSGNISLISIRNESNSVISGGSVVDIQLNDSAVASISGGNITDALGIYGTATAHIYGKNFNFTPEGPYGWLTGNWADNTPFAIYCRNAFGRFPANLILHTIPEPLTMAFLLIGILGVRKFRG